MSREKPVPVQLRWLAHARSGDKGNTANVGLIALEPELYPLLARAVTAARVARHFRGMVSRVERFELPNLRALNFVIYGLLGAGVAASTRFDPQGKALGEWLRSRLADIPVALADNRRPAGPAQVPAHDKRRPAGPAEVPAHDKRRPTDPAHVPARVTP